MSNEAIPPQYRSHSPGKEKEIQEAYAELEKEREAMGEYDYGWACHELDDWANWQPCSCSKCTADSAQIKK